MATAVAVAMIRCVPCARACRQLHTLLHPVCSHNYLLPYTMLQPARVAASHACSVAWKAVNMVCTLSTNRPASMIQGGGYGGQQGGYGGGQQGGYGGQGGGYGGGQQGYGQQVRFICYVLGACTRSMPCYGAVKQ